MLFSGMNKNTLRSGTQSNDMQKINTAPVRISDTTAGAPLFGVMYFKTYRGQAPAPTGSVVRLHCYF
jgi:hypothetical protein